MRRAAILLVLLTLLPVASAQAPDPADAVPLACAAVGSVDPGARDLLPVCARAEPSAPQAAGDPAHDHGAAGDPAAAGSLVQDAQDTAGDVVEDPASAPDELAALVATVVQAVKDLIGIPVAAARDLASAASEGLDAAGAALAATGGAMASGAQASADAIGSGAAWTLDAATDAVAWVGSLVSGPEAVRVEAPVAAEEAVESIDAPAVERLLDRLPVRA